MMIQLLLLLCFGIALIQVRNVAISINRFLKIRFDLTRYDGKLEIQMVCEQMFGDFF